MQFLRERLYSALKKVPELQKKRILLSYWSYNMKNIKDVRLNKYMNSRILSQAHLAQLLTFAFNQLSYVQFLFVTQCSKVQKNVSLREEATEGILENVS